MPEPVTHVYESLLPSVAFWLSPLSLLFKRNRVAWLTFVVVRTEITLCAIFFSLQVWFLEPSFSPWNFHNENQSYRYITLHIDIFIKKVNLGKKGRKLSLCDTTCCDSCYIIQMQAYRGSERLNINCVVYHVLVIHVLILMSRCRRRRCDVYHFWKRRVITNDPPYVKFIYVCSRKIRLHEPGCACAGRRRSLRYLLSMSRGIIMFRFR